MRTTTTTKAVNLSSSYAKQSLEGRRGEMSKTRGKVGGCQYISNFNEIQITRVEAFQNWMRAR